VEKYYANFGRTFRVEIATSNKMEMESHPQQ